MSTNLEVGKTSDALANLTTPQAPQTPWTPWGFSPQAKRLLSTPSLSPKHQSLVVGIEADRL